jgi:hypothetical protein
MKQCFVSNTQMWYWVIVLMNFVTFIPFRIVSEFIVMYHFFMLDEFESSRRISIFGIVCIQVLNFNLIYKLIKSEIKFLKV